MRVNLPPFFSPLRLLLALVFMQLLTPLAWSEEFDAAKAYKKYCAACHGVQGAADTIASSNMVPPPTNFTTPESLNLSEERMLKALVEGKPGTAMTSWKEMLTLEQMKGVIQYIQTSLMLSSRDKNSDPGRQIFAKNCSVCHGDKGNVAVWAQNGLMPPPRDFTSDRARQELTRDRMFYSITHGRPESAMPAWGDQLKPEEVQMVMEYIRKVFMFPKGEPTPEELAAQAGSSDPNATHQHNHYDRAEMAKPMPFNLVGNLESGRNFYESNCYVCHGKDGDGKGPRADFIFPKPRNFLHPAAQHKFSREHLFFVISDGITKTEMSAWKHVLDKQEIANIAEYVFQKFIVPGLPEGFLEIAAQELSARPAMGHQHGGGSHNHPGLPFPWILPILIAIPIITLWALRSPPGERVTFRTLQLTKVPLLGGVVRFLNSSPQPLAALKLLSATLYLLVIVSGLLGVTFAERNFATVMVWGLWWPLVIISVFFVGSAWCAICPWETLAKLLVFRRLWRRPASGDQRERKVPQYLRNVWPALLLFVGLSWLELGINVTTNPFATALMALLMLILATLSLLLFERKAFCRYFCPVGRTIGYYSRLAPIEIRPLEEDVCTRCTTMECYHGTKNIEPCPTHLTLGRFAQNTFCISCGSCVLSCPHKNVSWRLRPMGSEAVSMARPQWDGSWFMLGLLGITIFHGITMMSFWENWINTLATLLGETGQPLITFTLLMIVSLLAPIGVYAVAVQATRLISRTPLDFKQIFTKLAFCSLPLAFSYHLAHNVDHLLREAQGFYKVFANPLGLGTSPMTSMERHFLMMSPLVPNEWLYTLQTGLMLLGFWLAVQIIRYRALEARKDEDHLEGMNLFPMLLFVIGVVLFNLWLLGQDMVMRM